MPTTLIEQARRYMDGELTVSEFQVIAIREITRLGDDELHQLAAILLKTA